MKRRIYYLLLLLEGCCLVALYNFQGLRFLLCCAVCIPLACFLLLIPMALSCTVSIETRQLTVTRGEPARFRVIVEKGGFLPAAGALVCISWKAPGEKERKARKRLNGFGQKTGADVSFELSAMHCGTACFKVTKARLFDYLGIFSLPMKRREKSMEICIYPIVTPMPRETMVLDPRTMGREEEGDMLLRDYKPGDSLHRVYWKLFAKVGELQIRDFEQGGSIRIFLDFSADYRNRQEEWDGYLDKVCSLLYFLVEEPRDPGFSVEVAWRQKENFLKYHISDIVALQAWVGSLLGQEPVGAPFVEEEIPFLGEAFCMKEDCRLYLGEQWVYG